MRVLFVFFFFFSSRRRHTRCSRDWSSDVCSSDLSADGPAAPSPLGRRIRQARQELGLSLREVAGDDFSRAFLNQIELGHARPSTQNLRIIARRLQRPIEYFLEDPGDSTAALELALAEAEMGLHQGEAERSETLMVNLLARPLPNDLRTRAQLTLA